MSLSQPLPERLRPSELALFVGQSHLAERLTTLLEGPRLPSLLLFGPPGCGKSTLAKHFNAILLPEAGTVLVEGMDTRNEDHLYDVRQKVGMVFQNPDNQIVATIVEEDVAFAPENLGVPPEEIRTRIDSVQQTLKITNAMYLISSSKLRKARQQLNNVQPYFLKISSTIADILHHSPEIEHIYFDKRPEVKHRKSGYIVITGDKGLAGAYNHNVLRLAEKHLAQEDDPTLFLIGQMGRAYFAERDIRVDGEFMFTVQDPTIARARDIADIFIRLFREGQLDDVYVVYTEMITPMRLEPRVQKLLPLDLDAFPWEPRPSEHGPYHQMVQYVPSADRVLEHLVPGYVKGELFGALVESFCAEQNARMTAMDSATDNARDMLKSLSLRYNRARQSAITQEITEIVGGTQGSAAETPQPRRPIPTRTVRFLADGRRA